VWVVTGDGDGLSIGGNHMAHLLRRNVDLNVLLFNNRIYGLTKGQYSPTSEIGKKTKSSPMGSIDHPFNPIAFALGCGASYISRSVDVFASHLRDTLTAANGHAGTSFVEILQNCNIFNDGAWDSMVDKDHRDGRVLYMEHGKPLVWGSDDNKYGFILDGLSIKPVKLGETYQETDCVLHDKHSLILATMLANLDPSDGAPLAVGTFYESAKSTYDSMFATQISDATARLGAGDLAKLLNSGETWTV
jgi:2-oxoglutarate ferredoxin oxidoreductase subunit beta